MFEQKQKEQGEKKRGAKAAWAAFAVAALLFFSAPAVLRNAVPFGSVRQEAVQVEASVEAAKESGDGNLFLEKNGKSVVPLGADNSPIPERGGYKEYFFSTAGSGPVGWRAVVRDKDGAIVLRGKVVPGQPGDTLFYEDGRLVGISRAGGPVEPVKTKGE
ncbi:hypothetical protein [Thermodesulfitimonas autotrophica]|uniref:hypothetical protein n=1 Tax=Thermodesulfitimonas autotrophica TaxID=1894989 RepID=UPI002FDF1416